MASSPSAPDPDPDPTPPLAPDSASAPEKSARSAPTAKLRSCVVCRSRKVRCDKLSPCSNCRRANIPCVVPSNDRPPRWARRLERFNGDAQTESRPSGDQALERLQTLENLVKELRGQLEVANASSRGASSDAASPPENVKVAASPSSSTAPDVQKHFGRMVLKDANQRRYIASGFWSRISDELEGLKMDTRRMGDDGASSEDQDFPASTPSTQEQHREPAERHAFLFQNDMSLSSPGGQDFNPLPSQIPFLLDVFEENMNIIMHVVHMPSIRKMVRSSRGSRPQLALKHQALLFSIYYAAITSMEDDDVLTNFGATKIDLNLKFRRGLEQTLARADFLNDPDIVHVQTLTIFLALARRYDSPVYIWMMTGLLIRMARSVGLHRDGSQFPHLSPFEVEQRRRLWWMVTVVDIRASEDQGTEFTITEGSFDTKMPLNINDSDIEPETKEMPSERQGVTDMSLGVAMCELALMSMQLMASSPQTGGLTLEDQARLLRSHRSKLEEGCAKYSNDPDDIINWVGIVVTRLVLSKLTLLVYLPSLFASPSDRFSDEVRDTLLIAAIEIAEHNHALNAETRCRQWRWIYQTYTHWYAIVWLLIEISRRQWSPTVERAWIALHSPWLIPSQNTMANDVRMWIPLRKLMARARSHRGSQLEQIQNNSSLIDTLERIDGSLPIPASTDSSQPQEKFLQNWRMLVWQTIKVTPDVCSSNNGGDSHGDHGRQLPNKPSDPPHINFRHSSSAIDVSELTTLPQNWVNGQPMEADVRSWLWTDPNLETEAFTDADMNMDIDTDIDWNTWLQSATGLEMNTGKQNLP